MPPLCLPLAERMFTTPPLALAPYTDEDGPKSTSVDARLDGWAAILTIGSARGSSSTM